MKTFFRVVALAAFCGTVTAPVMADDDPSSTALSSHGDAEKGKRIFNRCKACHNLTAADRSRMGPNLDNLFGRQAGSKEDYKYSKALAEADFVWTEEKLDQWLMSPKTFLPGNKMAFAGLRKEDDRKDLMAYLRKATVAGE
ncbi:c-type cytochrome [Kordiimonas aestuarii]|uniref:c-type cytochrome n=1 Tax=Kordiimonas aestuarii TaxID=1005925 RepID=UPI0021D03C78|nr:cytochrome c family protein [Kordiimonas aestuarii]